MDYLLDRYFFGYLPVEVSEETKKSVGEKALSVVMWADWLCKYQDPRKIFENHTSFLFGELLFFTLCTLTFLHAYRNGARYMFVWIAILIHALNVENLCYWIPDMDNFWQAQGILTFFGMRAPLYIILGIYHMFDYCAYVMVRRMRLPWWAEGPAVGLCAVMLDMPYDIMGIKLLWWTWHDTDPNILHRMYWVPWTSYYFHASFACSLVWILKASRYFLVEETYDWKKIPRELLCAFIAGMGAFWLGVCQFGIFYHPLRDYFGVHTEVIVCLFLGFYALVVITADRHNTHALARVGNKFWFDEVACAIALEYTFYMILVVIADPVNIVAEGLHQPIGDCLQTQPVRSFVKLLSKKKYLCLKNYDEKYFDFHCIPNGGLKMPEDGSPLEWYAACGTDFENRAEYITIIWGICILFGWIFYQMAARSGPLPIDPVKQYRRKIQPSPAESPVSSENDKLLKARGGNESPASKNAAGKSKSATPKKSPVPSLETSFEQMTDEDADVLPALPSRSEEGSGVEEEPKRSFKTPRATRGRGRPPVTPGFVPEPTPSRSLRARKALSYKV